MCMYAYGENASNYSGNRMRQVGNHEAGADMFLAMSELG